MSDERRKPRQLACTALETNPTDASPRKRNEGSAIRKNGVVSRGTRSKAIRSLKTPSMTS